MLILPFHVDVPMRRWPVANFLIILANVYVFVQLRSGLIGAEQLYPYVLGTGDPRGLLGHAFIHFGVMHLFGNMIFLWCFGNAVCAKVGNIPYVLIYALLIVVSGMAHILVDGRPGIGASGAVNGVVGMFLVLYPRNNISCLLWFVILIRTFSLSSIWMILFWLMFDLYGALQVVQGSAAAGNVAYWAHLGGFGAGFALVSAILSIGTLEMGPTEESLYEWLGWS